MWFFTQKNWGDYRTNLKFRSSYNVFSKKFLDLIINNWLLFLRTVMLMTPFRWLVYLLKRGKLERLEVVSKISWSDVRKYQFEKKFLIFPASKIITFSFSCELSLQTSHCCISFLFGIFHCCWKSCCCCYCC